MEVLTALVLVALLSLLLRGRRRDPLLDELKQQLLTLEHRMRALELHLDARTPPLLLERDRAESVQRATAGPAPPPAAAPPSDPQLRQPPPQARPIPSPAARALKHWLPKLGRFWSENWTGILGTAAVVAGVTFVAINLAMRLDALQRFLLISTAAAALAMPSLLIGRRQRWRDLCDWMRSGGGALFLFACTAAGALPQLGLRWIDQPGQALALLSLGLAMNLAVAGISRNQTVAGLHVVLSLIPLTICPQTSLALLLASFVALIGQQLPGRRRWEIQGLTVTWSMLAFHASWFLRNSGALENDPWLRGTATGLGLLVFGAAVLLEHRPLRLQPQLKPLPLAGLLSGWGALMGVLMLYPPEGTTRAGGLALAAGAALVLAQHSRRYEACWLQRSDRLVAQGLAMAALLSLQPVLADPPRLAWLLLLECSGFLALAVLEGGDGLIRQVGWWLTGISALALAVTGLDQALDHSHRSWYWLTQLQSAGLLISGSVLLGAVALLLERRRITVPSTPLLGWLAGLLVFIGSALAAPLTWQPSLSLVVMGGLLLLARALGPPSLLSGISGAVLALHGRMALPLLLLQPWAADALLSRLLPLIALAAILIGAGQGSWRRALGIHLLGLDLLLGAYLLAEPVSPLMVGVLWLLLAVLSLELADRLRPTEARHVLLVGLLHLIAFAGSYLLVISQSPAYLQLGSLSVRGRLLIELFAIAVALYWWCFNGLRSLHGLPLWQRLHPCFLEAWLLGVAVTILMEITTLWRPVAWSVLALALISPPLRRLCTARVQVYAVVVQWVAVGSLVAILSSLPSPASHWSQQPGQIALLAIALQVGFIAASHHWLNSADLRNPGGLSPLAWIGRRVADRPYRWLYVPEFAAVALYLAIRYDHTLRTLLWALEAFVVYGLGAALRDQPFRHLALAAMGACLLRLVSVDLAEADLGLRGLVFIGVGVLMLGMNTIYTRSWSDPR